MEQQADGRASPRISAAQQKRTKRDAVAAILADAALMDATLSGAAGETTRILDGEIVRETPADVQPDATEKPPHVTKIGLYWTGRRQKVLDALRIGATRHMACKYAGISYQTFYTWMQEHPDFVEQVGFAEGKAVVSWLEVIESAAQRGEWTAAAWKLERRYPKDYGRRTFVDLEDRLRAAAIAEGIDPDVAVAEGRQLLTSGSMIGGDHDGSSDDMVRDE